MNKTSKRIGIALLVLLFAGSVGLLSYCGYYWNTKKTSTATFAYVNSLAYAEDETYFAEVNYYDNKLQNGAEVFETRLNYYTDPETSEDENEKNFKTVYSSGIQFFGKPKFETKDSPITGFPSWGFLGLGKNKLRSYVPVKWTESKPEGAYYYNGTFGRSYGPTTELSIRDKWIVDFDGKISRITQRGIPIKLDKNKEVLDSSQIVASGAQNRYYRSLDINDFLYQMIEAVKLTPVGTQVLLFDLSKWFEGHLYEDGRFHEIADGDDNYMYINVKVNHSRNGLITASQSIFGTVKGDEDYSFSSDLASADYYKNETVYNLSVADFDFTLSNGTNYFGQINETAANFLSAFNNLRINITINLDSNLLDGKKFYGFSTDPFRGLKVNQIIIYSATSVTFYLPQQMKNIITSNVTLAVV